MKVPVTVLDIPMAGYRSATAASSSPTAPSIRSSRSTRGRLSRTSGSAPRSPSSARSSCAASRYGAARKHRAGAISATPVCLKSAEPFYEPGVLALARQNNRCGFERGASGAGRTLRYAKGCVPARRPTPVTFVNGRNGDISIWWTQSLPASSSTKSRAEECSRYPCICSCSVLVSYDWPFSFGRKSSAALPPASFGIIAVVEKLFGLPIALLFSRICHCCLHAVRGSFTRS